MSLKKPLFSCVMKEEYLDEKIGKDKFANRDIYEPNNQEKFKAFKKLVMSKIVSQCNSYIEIENAVLKKMNEFERNTNLIGWIRASESSDSALLSDEIARLSKENHGLREQINTINIETQNSLPDLMIHGTSFHEIVKILNKIFLSEEDLTDIVNRSGVLPADVNSDSFYDELIKFTQADNANNLVNFLCHFSNFLISNGILIPKGLNATSSIFSESNLKILFDLDIVKVDRKKIDTENTMLRRYGSDTVLIRATSSGETFIKYLRIENLKKGFLNV